MRISLIVRIKYVFNVFILAPIVGFASLHCPDETLFLACHRKKIVFTGRLKFDINDCDE